MHEVASFVRAAVASLPLLIMPLLLVSRVAYGDGGQAWNYISPFAPLLHAGQDLEAKQRVLWALSLPMVSRPASAALDLHAHPEALRLVVAEWLHLGILVTGYLLVFYIVHVRPFGTRASRALRTSGAGIDPA